MFRHLVFSLSVLVASTGASVAGMLHHPADIRIAHSSYAAEYAGHDSTERRDVAPAPPATPAQPSVRDIIFSAFAPLGPGAVNWAWQIAWCESKYDPNAVNPASNAQGLFQFLPSTWAGTPYAAYSPFDPGANANAAVWLLQAYGPTQWECRA